MVQQELHPQDEGREGDGNPGQPVADEAAAGIPEALTLSLSSEEPAALPPTEPPGTPPTEPPLESQLDAALAATPVEPALVVGGVAGGVDALVATPKDMRIEFDERSSAAVRRLAIVKEELVAWFKTLASAAVYATLIVTFGFQVARVEGQSMAPTLADQDRLIVNKLAYRLGEPRRGDIVMLYYPLNPDKSFVKRVIAEEGDTVRIVDGRVYVNDVPMRDDFVPPDYRSHDDFGPNVVREGYYFVMGDHRNNSSDSRHWGEVPKKYIIGRVQVRWWPLPTARVF